MFFHCDLLPIPGYVCAELRGGPILFCRRAEERFPQMIANLLCRHLNEIQTEFFLDDPAKAGSQVLPQQSEKLGRRDKKSSAPSPPRA